MAYGTSSYSPLSLLNPLSQMGNLGTLVKSLLDSFEDESNGITEDIRNLEKRLQERGVFHPYTHPITLHFASDRDFAPLVSSMEIAWDSYQDQGFRLLLREERMTSLKGAPRIKILTPLVESSSSSKVRAYPHLDKFLTGLAKSNRQNVIQNSSPYTFESTLNVS